MVPPRRRLSRCPLRAPNPVFELPDGIRAFPDGFFRSRTAIQRTRAPGLLSGRPSKKPGGSGTFPDARDTFPGRHPGNPGIREAILAVGKAIQPFGFVPEASGASISRRGPLFSRRDGHQEPRARKSGIRKAKAGTGMASREVLQVDQACLGHSTILGSALEGMGGSERRRALEQEDSSSGPMRPGSTLVYTSLISSPQGDRK
jgi:hypothetical protein